MIVAKGSYSVSCNAARHLNVQTGGAIITTGCTITFLDNVTFSNAFVFGFLGGI